MSFATYGLSVGGLVALGITLGITLDITLGITRQQGQQLLGAGVGGRGGIDDLLDVAEVHWLSQRGREKATGGGG